MILRSIYGKSPVDIISASPGIGEDAALTRILRPRQTHDQAGQTSGKEEISDPIHLRNTVSTGVVSTGPVYRPTCT